MRLWYSLVRVPDPSSPDPDPMSGGMIGVIAVVCKKFKPPKIETRNVETSREDAKVQSAMLIAEK